MKIPFKWVIICAASALLTQGALAHDKSKSDNQSTQSQKTFRASKLIGQTAKDSQGQDLGKLDDIVINPQNNEIFAVLNMGDNRLAPVPWQLIQVTTDASGNQQLSLNSTKDNLKAAPTVSKDQYSNLSDSSFTDKIYSFFHTQAPSAMGGTGAGSSEMRGSGQQQQQPSPEQQPQSQPQP